MEMQEIISLIEEHIERAERCRQKAITDWGQAPTPELMQEANERKNTAIIQAGTLLSLLEEINEREDSIMEQNRLNQILTYIRYAADLAGEEAQKQRELHPRTAAFQATTIPPESIPPQMQEISGAFNMLTANLIYAGMPLRPGNEIYIRIKNAISEALAQVQTNIPAKEDPGTIGQPETP